MFTKKFIKIWLNRYLQIKKIFSFDVETTGLNYFTDRIFSFCLCDKKGNVEIWRLDTRDKQHNKEGWKRLKEIFADSSIAKLAHNYKFELHFLKRHNIWVHPHTVWHDTMLISRLIRNLHFNHDLAYLGWEVLDYKIKTPFGKFGSREIDKKVKNEAESYGNRYDKVNKTLMYWYQYADAERPMLLFLIWIEIFKKNIKLFIEYIVEILYVPVACDMETTGMRVHPENIKTITNDLKIKLEKTRDLLYYRYKEYINVLSEQQLIRILYKIEKFPIIKVSSKTGLPLSNKEIIFELKERYPTEKILDWIIQARSYTNGVSMLESYLEHADKNDIIHPNLNTCQARTHRQSSSNPNLQNVAKEKALKNLYPVPARKCFQCKPKHFLILGDYAGIQMRIIIELANSIKMIDAMKRGENPHIIACKIFYGKLFKSKEENYDLYAAGKGGHFALGFGAGIPKLAKTLLIPERQAFENLHKYAETFPEIAYLIRTVAQEVEEYGYVTTPFGSKLYIPMRKAYMGLNYKAQNTEAKIMKRAQINVDKYLKNFWSNDVKISMMVHDELIFDFPYDLVKKKDEILYDCSQLMIDIPELKVPMEVEYEETHTTWNAKKEIKLKNIILYKKLYKRKTIKMLKGCLC